MAYIKVDINKLRGFEQTAANLSREMTDIRNTLSKLRNSLDWDVRAEAGIEQTMASITSSIDSQSILFNKMSNFFAYAHREYSQLEKGLMSDLKEFKRYSIITPGKTDIVDNFFDHFGITTNILLFTNPLTHPWFVVSEIILKHLLNDKSVDVSSLINNKFTKTLTLLYLDKTKAGKWISKSLRNLHDWLNVKLDYMKIPAWFRTKVLDKIPSSLGDRAKQISGKEDLEKGLKYLFKKNVLSSTIIQALETSLDVKESVKKYKGKREEVITNVTKDITTGLWRGAVVGSSTAIGTYVGGALALPSGPGSIAAAAAGGTIGGMAGNWVADKTEFIGRKIGKFLGKGISRTVDMNEKREMFIGTYTNLMVRHLRTV